MEHWLIFSVMSSQRQITLGKTIKVVVKYIIKEVKVSSFKLLDEMVTQFNIVSELTFCNMF